ncbi:hypothetical protein [Herbiconiux sp. YIM B11900]|uniref:hypothetical protein n=1 Tax=Herbiconiux sp. YIM B11900 TaxID=3404131 RepID=UPI003F8407ED
MPTVTGSWKDLGLQVVDSIYAPRLAFRLSSAAISPAGVIMFTTPKYVTPNPTTGAFSVVLTRTDNLRPGDPTLSDVWINVYADWLEDSSDPNSGFSQFIAKMRVYNTDAVITDLIQAPGTPALLYVGTTPPPNATPTQRWIDTSPIAQGGKPLIKRAIA